MLGAKENIEAGPVLTGNVNMVTMEWRLSTLLLGVDRDLVQWIVDSYGYSVTLGILMRIWRVQYN